MHSKLPKETSGLLVALWLGVLAAAFAGVLALILTRGGGDDDGDAVTSTSTPNPQAALEAQLEATLLTLEDVPQGMQAAGLSFTSNEDAANAAPDPQAELVKFGQVGRLLAVDVFFSPFSELPADEPVRGGIQQTVVFYLRPEGAEQHITEKIELAKGVDFAAIHAEETDVQVRVLDRNIGDESIWFRTTGTTASGEMAVDDQIIFRTGRAGIFLRVLSAFPAGSPEDSLAERVQQWAELVNERTLVALAEATPAATPAATGTAQPSASP